MDSYPIEIMNQQDEMIMLLKINYNGCCEMVRPICESI